MEAVARTSTDGTGRGAPLPEDDPVHANPYLRSLALSAVAARRAPAVPAAVPASASTPLATVADLPVGTPLAELCPTVELRCPTRDGRRLHLRKLFADLLWHPEPETELTVVVAPDRPVLWVAGAVPPAEAPACSCGCGNDHRSPADRLLAAGHALPEPATVDASDRVRLTPGHLAAIEATDAEPLAVAGLFDLGLLAVATATDLALHGALTDVRVPDV